jgi:hypothetical protein
MGASFAKDFKAAHPDEIGPNGVIKVCIGGGAGFIGSHIAKRLMEEVWTANSTLSAPSSFLLFMYPITSTSNCYRRAATWSALIGKRMNS